MYETKCIPFNCIQVIFACQQYFALFLYNFYMNVFDVSQREDWGVVVL